MIQVNRMNDKYIEITYIELGDSNKAIISLFPSVQAINEGACSLSALLDNVGFPSADSLLAGLWINLK